MKVIQEGHHYKVETAQGHHAFDIVFCGNQNGSFMDGITNEELCDILESRLAYLVKQKPTSANMDALTHAKQMKHWIHTRNHQKQMKRKHNDFPPVINPTPLPIEKVI